MLFLLFKKEWPCANRSWHFLQKSDHAKIALLLWKNEQFSKKVCSFHHVFWHFFIDFCESLPSLLAVSLFLKERRERFALIALYKRVTMWDSLPSHFKKSQIGISSLKKSKSLLCSFAHKKQWFTRTTKEQIPNPGKLVLFFKQYNYCEFLTSLS